MNVEAHKTYIGRLRTSAPARDAEAQALRLRHALAALDLHPHGLPAQTVVCLRRLHAPMPAHFAAGLADDPVRLRTWAAATVNALESIIRQAARPASGVVPAGAECVVFNDRAELLACLAVDWCDGRTYARWWWRTLFKPLDLDAPVRLFLRTPEYVPAAFTQLAAQQRLVPLAQKLTTAEAHALLESLGKTFALHALADQLTVDWARAAPARVATSEMRADSAALLSERRAAPWQHVVPELQTAELPPAQQALVGISLMLARAPARVRTQDFAQAVRAWHAAQHAETRSAHTPVQEAPTSAQTAAPCSADAVADMLLANAHVHASTSDNARMQARAHKQPTALADHQAHGLTPTAEHRRATELSTHARQSPPIDDSETKGRSAHADVAERLPPEQTTSALPVASASQAARTLDVEVEARSNAAPDLSEHAATGFERNTHAGSMAEPLALSAMQIETRYGGLFFLLNLALYLELYGDFSAPLAPCLPLVVWDFVALLGAQLLGAAVRADAIWSLLAQLARRDVQSEPGAEFVPTDEWRMPGAWLKPWPMSGAWRWSAARRRLRVKHPLGFLVLDLPRDDRCGAQQLADELRAYAGLYTDEPVRVWRGLKLAGRTARARWLERLAAYVGVRLRLALGQESKAEAARLLCTLTARVAVTATHVDLFFSLAELPVEVRRSGLDRDPGWLPAAGHFIAFHFD